MKNFAIVSPSKNRLDFTIDKVLGKNICMFVEPQDIQKYNNKASSRVKEIIKIDANDQGFGYVLKEIIYCLHARKIKHALFADDDIYGLKTRDNKKVKDINPFVKEGISILKKNKYAELMVSFSGHNWYTKEQIKENVGCWGMVFLDVEKIYSVGNYDVKLKIFNDWDMSARLILKSHKTACWYDYQFKHKMKSKKGGASFLYEDSEFMESQCNLMIKRYGNAVKKIYHEAHKQYEIRFDWKKLKQQSVRVPITSFLSK